MINSSDRMTKTETRVDDLEGIDFACKVLESQDYEISQIRGTLIIAEKKGEIIFVEANTDLGWWWAFIGPIIARDPEYYMTAAAEYFMLRSHHDLLGVLKYLIVKRKYGETVND